MPPLTRRQAQILSYVEEFIEDRGYSPSLEEMADALGLSSVATVHKHVANLIDKGLLRRSPHRSRTIELAEPEAPTGDGLAELPLLGVIAAGSPIEAISGSDTVPVPPTMLKRGRRCYCLKVEGTSMIGEQIRDGDIVIIEDRGEVRDGETVVALIDNDQTTLKKLYRRGREIHLVAANPAVRTLVLSPDRVRVQGVVIGLMRQYA